MALSAEALLTVAEAKTLLGIASSTAAQDATIEALINAASGAIENALGGLPIVIRAFDEQYAAPLWGYGRSLWIRHGMRTLALKRYPIVTVTSIADPAGFPILATEYVIEAEHGFLQRPGGWSWPQDTNANPARWRVQHTAGRAANTAAVPQVLKLAAARMVAFGRSNPIPGIASKTMGQVSVAYAGPAGMDLGSGLPIEVWGLIAPYASRDT